MDIPVSDPESPVLCGDIIPSCEDLSDMSKDISGPTRDSLAPIGERLVSHEKLPAPNEDRSVTEKDIPDPSMNMALSMGGSALVQLLPDLSSLPVKQSAPDEDILVFFEDRDSPSKSTSDGLKGISDPNRNTPVPSKDIRVLDQDTQDIPGNTVGPAIVRQDPIEGAPVLTENIPDLSRDRATSCVDRSIPQADLSVPDRGTPFPDAMAAVRIGARLGEKACRVLGYLNAIRSPKSQSHTLPIGYSRIHEETGVSVNYLRNKILPKLAKARLIAVARKGLEGTTYRLLHEPPYIQLVISGEIPHPSWSPECPSISQRTGGKNEASSQGSDRGKGQRDSGPLPAWVNREHWGQLSSEMVRQLIAKAGSEQRATEILQIITYNETHGPDYLRIPDRHSVLTHYLASPDADIWPNDSGYETLEIRRARIQKELAQKERQIAEEALRARREADQARFLALLSEAQLRWIRQEAKRRVDGLPTSQHVPLESRYTRYKAEEDQIIEEWMDRMAYGETVPTAAEESGPPTLPR